MDHPLPPLTTTRAMRRLLQAGAESAAPIEAARWLSGPQADPLRATPWLSAPLPRSRYAKPITVGRRIRSLLILLCVLVLVAGILVLALQADHVWFGTPLPTLPRLPLP